MLRQQLAYSSGPRSEQYLPRRVGVGSTTGHMHWQVSMVSPVWTYNPQSGRIIPTHSCFLFSHVTVTHAIAVSAASYVKCCWPHESSLITVMATNLVGLAEDG